MTNWRKDANFFKKFIDKLEKYSFLRHNFLDILIVDLMDGLNAT